MSHNLVRYNLRNPKTTKQQPKQLIYKDITKKFSFFVFFLYRCIAILKNRSRFKSVTFSNL